MKLPIFSTKASSPINARRWITLSLKSACILAALLLTVSLHAADILGCPRWWIERGVFIPGKAPDDFSPANLGQLKNMAVQAAAELDARLPGGAGAEINAMLDQWSEVQGGVRIPKVLPNTDDYAFLNIGQLKATVKPYYDRLAAAGIIAPGLYPWKIHGAHESHAAVANIGQLKYVFSFIAYTPGPTEDSDDDQLPDTWEILHFGNLGHSGGERALLNWYPWYNVYLQGQDPAKIINGVYVP